MTLENSDIDGWEIEAIHIRYQETHQLSLTTNQAYLIFRYEQLRSTPSTNHYFSFWEELDFEFVSFKEILTAEQFDVYRETLKETLRHNEDQLVLLDKEFVMQLEASEDLLNYYLTDLLPALERQRMFISPAFVYETEKVAFLKAEYKKFLDNNRKSILVNHFRHSRKLQPNLLKFSLLRHQLICLLPDYYSFRAAMDVPTAGVANYLEEKFKRSAEMIRTSLIEPLQALAEFRRANTQRHLGEIKGWHTIGAIEEECFMFILLLDRQMYGC